MILNIFWVGNVHSRQQRNKAKAIAQPKTTIQIPWNSRLGIVRDVVCCLLLEVGGFCFVTLGFLVSLMHLLPFTKADTT